MEKQICGVYIIQNKINNKVYIGQSCDIISRWGEHLRALRGNYHVNNHLQHAWNKYGEDNFDFSIIKECDECHLDDEEIYWILKYDSYNNGYNQTKGGGGIRGFKHSEETRQKISEITKGENAPWYGKKRSNETKAKIGQSSKKMWTDEFRRYMSSVHRGKIISEEAKQKMSKSQKERWTDELRSEFSKKFSGEGNPMYGKRFFGKDNPNYGNHKLAGANNPNCHRIYCPELDEVFWGIKDAFDKYGVNRTSISQCLSGKRQSAGKHPITGEKLHWIDAAEMNDSSVA